MNYRHVYHAGNFADVTKHVILTALISCLSRKDTPYCYIDTHAGTGCYDLSSTQATKTNEFQNGIEKIIHHDNPPPIIRHYLDCIHTINNRLSGAKFASLQYYPGSPLIVRQMARSHDRIVACELHPEEYQQLKNTFNGDKQVAVHHTDGFLGLKAFLPPKEKRGLVLIDPPYENPDEFTRLAHSLPVALKRWQTGIFAIWYPIKEKKQVEQFYNSIKTHVDQPALAVELSIYPDLPNHLNGSGMVIINPPWQLDEILDQNMPWLWNALTINKQGAYKAFMLK